MDPTAVLVAVAQLAAGFVIASVLVLVALIARDAHRSGMARVRRAGARSVSPLELRDLSRLDRLDGLDTRRDA